MIKLKNILNESILISRRSKDERLKYHLALLYKKIRKYIKSGCNGDLNLAGAPIEYLPNELKYVGGNLYLSNSLIKKLPDGLVIQNLDLRESSIEFLPNNLTVHSFLYIDWTKISEIPNNLNVGKYFYCYSTPLSEKYTEKEIKQMIIDKGGSVRMVKTSMYI